jgi:hypothetical protein
LLGLVPQGLTLTFGLRIQREHTRDHLILGSSPYCQCLGPRGDMTPNSSLLPEANHPEILATFWLDLGYILAAAGQVQAKM